ncbi:hypothetical protein EDD99_8121 [Streptomyces sp. 846.5]|nr:hypothetical protein [Streptomyces sp. 846.5]TDT93312.1 hypothetical protein EDD99_8121 [Streptomyces sp. 846.5]
MSNQSTTAPAAAALLAEARQAYGTPTERAVRAAQAEDNLHNAKVHAAESAQSARSSQR